MRQREIFRINDMTEMLGLSKATLWRWTRAGILPRPIYIGNRVFGWRKATILEWLDSVEESAK
jgi:prophage regulatory protein